MNKAKFVLIFSLGKAYQSGYARSQQWGFSHVYWRNLRHQ